METMRAIEKVTEAAEWYYPLFPVEKSDNHTKLCFDLTKLNSATEGRLYQLASVKETLAKLGRYCKIMSNLDVNFGYWQRIFDPESQLKAIFIILSGRYCLTYAPFDVVSLQEIFNLFNCWINNIIEGLERVGKSMDDFLSHGKTIGGHEERIRKFSEGMKKRSVILNSKKFLIRQKQGKLLVHLILASWNEAIKVVSKLIL